jgi:tetratricopeptide (TPR) repeat protein
MNLAELYAIQNRPAKAAELVRVLSVTCTNCVETLEWLVSFYASNSMLDEAAECLDRLIQLEPDSFDHWSSRAAVAYERNHPDEGLRYITRAAEIDKFRLRRMLTAGNFLQELLKDGNTNLVNQLEQLIRVE